MPPDELTVISVTLDVWGHMALVVCGVDVRLVPLALSRLGVPRPVPVVVVNGGTAPLGPEGGAIRAALAVVVAACRCTGAAIVCGGTDAGVFRLLGDAVGPARDVPMIGVAPDALVAWFGRGDAPADAAMLEPHISHAVLTPGRAWGDETATMLAVAASMSIAKGSVAVIAGGGRVTEQEVEGHLAEGRPVVVLGGSGRADELSGSLRGIGSDVTVVDVGTELDLLSDIITERLLDPPA